MAMNVEFFTYSGNKNVLNKEGTLMRIGTTRSCVPYERVSNLEGYIIVDYNADFLNANYCKFLGKSYFISDRELMTGQKMKIYTEVDVLNSFNTDILKCPAISERTSVGDRYIIDPMLNVKSYEIVKNFDKIGEFTFDSNGVFAPEMVCFTVG